MPVLSIAVSPQRQTRVTAEFAFWPETALQKNFNHFNDGVTRVTHWYALSYRGNSRDWGVL
jgi:hypothetical protein